MSEPPADESAALHRRAFRRKLLIWSVNGMGLLAFYPLVYPFLFILFCETFDDWISDPVYTALELSVAPLGWLADEVPHYESYLDWLLDLLV